LIKRAPPSPGTPGEGFCAELRREDPHPTHSRSTGRGGKGQLPRFHDLALTARPRPVTPYYLMISTTVQPEFSAALVRVKTPRVALEQARLRLEHLLAVR